MPSGVSGAAQREAARLASVTFFLDHQIGRYQVATALRAAGAKVEVHLDHFSGDAPDSDWIPEVASRGWVLVTKDQHIHRNPLERAAYESAKLRGFVITGKDMNAKELSELLTTCLHGMVRRCAGRGGPSLFTISRYGVFRKLL